jgi:hypothetical protein
LKSYRVAIVVDAAFGARLAALAERVHVWIRSSPANLAAAESVWRSRTNLPSSLDAGARTFTCAAGASPEEALLGVLESVDLHHGEYSHDPPWSVLEVLGCAPTAAVEVAAAEYGARVEPGPPAHFEIVRAIAARS